MHTDQEGVARLAGLHPGVITLETDQDTAPRHRATIQAGERTELRITLRPGVAVSGIVVDGTGSGVSGAKILLGNWAVARRRLRPVTTTGPDGRFAIPAADPSQWVSALAAGYAPSAQLGLHGQASGTVHVRLVLATPGGAVRGRVEGPEGQAIAGAVLRFGSERMNRAIIELPSGRDGMLPFPVELRTKADGSFHAQGLAAGAQPVAVRAPGFAPWSGRCWVVVGETGSLVVRLGRGFVCEGRVTDWQGEALGDVLIYTGEAATLGRRATRSAADGSYRLSSLPPGDLELVADGGMRGMKWTELRGTEGARLRWDLQFSGVTTLHGRVLSLRGEPLVGTTVGVSMPPAEGQPRRPMASLKTDAQGRFRYPSCPESGVTVNIMPTRRDHAQLLRTGVKPGQGEVVFRVEKFAAPSVTIRGRVLDAQGRPLRGVTLWPSRRKWRLTRPLPLRSTDGSFSLGPLHPDWHQLRIKASGHATHLTDERPLRAHETWDLGVIRLQRGGRAEVRFDRGAVGMARPAIGLMDSAGRWLGGRIAAGERAFSQRVAPGRYTLVVYGNGIADQSIPLAVKAGEDTSIRVTLHRGLSCSLRLLTTANAVRARVTNSQGLIREFDLRRRQPGPLQAKVFLVPGRYTVTAQTAAGERGKAAFQVAVGGGPVRLEVPLR